MTFWLHRFRKLDVRQKAHRKMLIDTFVNAIFLYDDKMVITFNYKDGTDTVTFDDLKTALDKEKAGSDLDCSTAPPKNPENITFSRVFSLPECLFDHNFGHNSVLLCSYKKRESFLYLLSPFHDSLLHPGRCFVLHYVEDAHVYIHCKRDGVMPQRF